jgi:uncharacterized glyoxalase superfamily protein PhnB
MDWKLELIVIPVADIDRAKDFYVEQAGFTLDVDYRAGEDFRVVQVSPPGSACSASLMRDEARAGTLSGMHLIVSDIGAARAALAARGVGVGEPFHFVDGARTEGPDPQHTDYGSFLTFADPDGNDWMVQEVPSRGGAGEGLARNRSVPPATVVPVLAYADVREAVAWLTAAFGLGERVRIGEGHRAQLAFDGGAVIVADVRGERRASRAEDFSHAVLVRVADVDAHCEHARRAGARILSEPTDHEYGERQYDAADLAGHRWTFTQTLRDLAPEQWGGETVGGGWS